MSDAVDRTSEPIGNAFEWCAICGFSWHGRTDQLDECKRLHQEHAPDCPATQK